jgi:hypothetical protein
MTERVVFHGIDSWNRPIFRALDKPHRFFGSIDKLVPLDASIESVLRTVTAADLTYFGPRFGCEAVGAPANVEIVRPPVDPDDIYHAREAVSLARGAIAMLEAMPAAARDNPEVVFSALELAVRHFRKAAALLKPAKAKRS